MRLPMKLILEIQRIIRESYERCTTNIITEKREKLDLNCENVIEVETLDLDKLKVFMIKVNCQSVIIQLLTVDWAMMAT